MNTDVTGRSLHTCSPLSTSTVRAPSTILLLHTHADISMQCYYTTTIDPPCILPPNAFSILIELAPCFRIKRKRHANSFSCASEGKEVPRLPNKAGPNMRDAQAGCGMHVLVHCMLKHNVVIFVEHCQPRCLRYCIRLVQCTSYFQNIESRRMTLAISLCVYWFDFCHLFVKNGHRLLLQGFDHDNDIYHRRVYRPFPLHSGQAG
jgi:hypothetical protein